MKALLLPRTGGLENLQWGEMPEPRPSDRDVVVRAKAVALNHLDVWPHKEAQPRTLKTPRVLGSDVSGTIDQVGSQVRNVKRGDPVMLAPGYGCGVCRACLGGRDNECPRYQLIGVGVPGGYAELVQVPATNAVPIPQGMGFAEAASIPLVFITAWEMLTVKARVRAGEWVLVHAAGSGVGIAAIQIAKLLGCQVVATASSQDKLDKAKAIGADFGVDYTRQGWEDEVQRVTTGHGADAVMDSVGATTYAPSIKCMALGGRLVICGVTSGAEVPNVSLRDLMAKQAQVIGSRMGSTSSLFEMLEFFKVGRLKPVVHKVYPFTQAMEAHREMLDRRNFGKIVLTW